MTETKRMYPDIYKRGVERGRAFNALRAELKAMCKEPLITFDSVDALFESIDREIKRRKDAAND